MNRVSVIASVITVSLICAGESSTADLVFGQAFGTAGFLSEIPGGTLTEAPFVVLAFTAADGHKNLTLTQQTGDFVVLLSRGKYCVTAYTRSGKPIQLAKNQLKRLEIKTGKEIRFDVMLLRHIDK